MCSTTEAMAPVNESPVPADLPLTDLEREICELAADLAAATCRWLLLVAEFDERRAWAEWGVHSCAHWLSWRCSIGLVAAREHVRVARRLRELPLVRAAFSAGELSYCKVRALTRVATAHTEASLVTIARHATGAQLERLVRGYRRVLAASIDDARKAHERRGLRWRWEDDGSLSFTGRLPAEDGALLLAALQAFQEPAAERADDSAESSMQLWVDGEPVPTPEKPSADARRADALITLVRAALTAADGTGHAAQPAEVIVHVDAATLAGDEIHERSELNDGPALAPETVRRLSCDAAIVRIAERDGQPLSVGRRTRTISPALRRALQARDRGCRFPGCTHRRFLHAHHIVHWARGGPTTLGNLIQLCSAHHRLVHEAGFQVQATAGGVRFRRPDGRPIPHCPPPTPSHGPPLAALNRSNGVQVDADTCRALSAGEHLDYGLAVDILLDRELNHRGAQAAARQAPLPRPPERASARPPLRA